MGPALDVIIDVAVGLAWCGSAACLRTSMKLISSLIFAAATAAGFAQTAPFTIARPADGSRVRETVRVMIPKDSVPEHGYIGFFIGNKFVEATLPPVDKSGKFYEYDLNTKDRGIPDGKLTLEAVLFVDYADAPRIVNRSSVEVTVSNVADNKVPAGGLLLRYKWTPGTELIYDVTLREITDESDTQKNAIGAKPIERSSDIDKLRVLYACDNAYPDGSGLVRMQALPLKGKDYLWAHLADTGGYGGPPTLFYTEAMRALYMHLAGTGLQYWGAVTEDIPWAGTAASVGSKEDLIRDFPLPTLPAKRVKVGDTWMSRFQLGDLSSMDDPDTYSLVLHYPAAGKFEGVEWEMGHPCAKLTDTIEEGVPSEEAKKLAAAGRDFTGQKVSMSETIWFALDRRQVIKVDRRITQDIQVANNSGFGNSGPNPGEGNGARPASGSRGPRAAGQSSSGSGSSSSAEAVLPPPPVNDQVFRQGPGESMSGPGGNPAPGPGRSGGGRGGAPSNTTFIRMTTQFIFVLEL